MSALNILWLPLPEDGAMRYLRFCSLRISWPPADPLGKERWACGMLASVTEKSGVKG